MLFPDTPEVVSANAPAQGLTDDLAYGSQGQASEMGISPRRP